MQGTHPRSVALRAGYVREYMERNIVFVRKGGGQGAITE